MMARITKTKSSKLFTRDIAAFNDAKLGQYLAANKGVITVEDPENLKNDKALLRRLRARTALDLDDLTARLEAASTDRGALPRPSSLGSHHCSRDTTQSLDAEEDYRHSLKDETECCNTLVSEGGRPSHPVSLGRDILENPGEYREILSYWQYVGKSTSWMVFGSQIGEWRRFLRYRLYVREEGRFPVYCGRLQRRLTRHGFERLIQLDIDPDRQDKLATWIEFLNYEYQDYEKEITFVERHQADYDLAWTNLVESRVLRSFETEEFICDINAASHHASEEEWAKKALESAKSAVSLVQSASVDPSRSHLSQQGPQQQRLAAARSQLAAATKSFKLIRRRNDLVYEFLKKTKLTVVNNVQKKQSYLGAKSDAEHRSILLQWILKQIPLIELELNQAEVAANGADVGDGTTKLKLHPTDDLTTERVSKRQRKDHGRKPSAPCRTRASIAPKASQDSSMIRSEPRIAAHEALPKRECYNSTGEERAVKRPRHGRQTLNAARPEPLPIQSESSGPNQAAAREPLKPRKRQAKVYKKERQSRRIAGHSPQFGMLPDRGEVVKYYKPPTRHPSNAMKAKSSIPRGHPLKKRSMAVKGAKPQGIRKAR